MYQNLQYDSFSCGMTEIRGAIPYKSKTFSIFAGSSKGDGHIDESVWLLSL